MWLQSFAIVVGATASAVSGSSITPVQRSQQRVAHEWSSDASSPPGMRGKIESDINDYPFEETLNIEICFFENTPCMIFYQKLVVGDSFWYGETDAKPGSQGTANIAKSNDGLGRIYGSVTCKNAVYSISSRKDGSLQVDAIAISDFPPEEDPSVNRSSLTLPVEPSDRKLTETTEEGGIIDVMVVYTTFAMCSDAGESYPCDTTSEANHLNILDRIDLAISETNTAFVLSGVDTQLNLVHAYMDESYNEDSAASGDFSTMLSHVTNDNDGYVDEVHNLRDEYGADLVAMVVSASAYCGMAWMYSGNEANGFSVTAYGCATGYYSFGHEIGHNMGCNHDRVTSGVGDNTDGYAYGYWDPDYNFRTILGYDCPTSCPRIQRFSNSNTSYDYDGSIIGTEIEDNARQINDVRVSIANWRNSQEPTTQPTSSSNPTSSFSPTVSPTETQCKATCYDQTCDYWAQWSDCGCYNSGNSLEEVYGCDCAGCDCEADVCSPPTTSPTTVFRGTPTEAPTTGPTASATKAPAATPTSKPTLSCEDDMDCPTDNLYCKCYEYEPSTGRRKLLFGAIGGCDGYCVEKE
uniref:Peptidase M12B domain-containing protein n=1 Tax=Octactis speculum TaxID=3111310 RepID=A0A7S2FPD8_9STRA|mmetsp:Transcript_26600/g.36570  ORF Transcript_26600/g.36570 Transcript_26600/m.36570 type:complete len:578 (+) Transcript_26600:91-1824(+)